MIFKLKFIYPEKSVNLHVQQTPNPLAHDPDEVPPLLEHSELFKKDIFKKDKLVR
jgi:hypothetical protein